MKLINPKTAVVIEVTEEHGKVLLKQGFYKRTDAPVTPKRGPGRPRKDKGQ